MAKVKTEEALTGIRKAAILLVSLPRDTAAKVMAQMDPLTLEEVSKEIARVRAIKREDRDEIVKEFYNLQLAQKYIDEGGIEYARGLLRQAPLQPREADRMLEILDKSIRPEAFTFLRNARPENVVTFLKDEHPQTIALIMTHLNEKQASAILAKLPAKTQVEAVKRIANLLQSNTEVIDQVESALRDRIGDALAAPLEEVDGVKAAADILKNVPDKSIERNILESIEEEDPDLADRIRKLMFVFDDIMLVPDRGIQSLLREIDTEELAQALKNVADELKEKFFKNMSARAADMMREDMEFMGPVRQADMEAAQQNIIDVVRRLQEQGEIVLEGQ